MNKDFEKEIEDFGKEFGYCFNIGVIPDDLTKNKIIDWFRKSYIRLEAKVREDIIKSIDTYYPEEIREEKRKDVF